MTRIFNSILLSATGFLLGIFATGVLVAYVEDEYPGAISDVYQRFYGKR